MKNYLFLITGTFFFAASVAIFAMPNSIAEGGVPGLALLIYHETDISPALTTLILNAVILLIGFRYLPKDMIIKSLVTIPLFSFFIYILEDLTSGIPDPLLALSLQVYLLVQALDLFSGQEAPQEEHRPLPVC